MGKKFLIEVTVLTLYFGSVLSHPVIGDDGFTLRVIHTNDMHSRFDETSALSTKCSERDEEAGKCYGGFARLATLIRQSRNSTIPTLFLNAGDTYQGSTWFTVHSWKIVSRFLNLLKPDAISLGNHEFDNGPEGLRPFLESAQFPIVTANIDTNDEPELKGINLKKSVVLSAANRKIGVIGYLTPETKIISKSGKVHFFDEVEAIRNEAIKLQSQGVKILIALGHSGFLMDKKIASEVEGIDLVIGGHTNTFLYTGKQPDSEVPEGLYPTEVKQKNGRKVYVVQAYAYTKYLGNLTVDFDGDGEVKRIIGDPILVDNNIQQAEDILNELNLWRPEVKKLETQAVGFTRVLLDGDAKNCRKEECNFGNMIADAMIDYNARGYPGHDGWTDAAIAFHTGGSIRSSIDKEPDDAITMSDVLAALPFNNGMGKVNVTGKQIREVLEWSVRSLNLSDTGNLNGAFMQFAGLQVEYNLSQPFGSRVVSVYVRCATCRIPDFSPLQEEHTYRILITDFLSTGGDGYDMFKGLEFTTLGNTTDNVVVDYIGRYSPIHPEVDWRITFVSDEKNSQKFNLRVNGKHKAQHDSSGSYKPINLMIFTPILVLVLGQ